MIFAAAGAFHVRCATPRRHAYTYIFYAMPPALCRTPLRYIRYAAASCLRCAYYRLISLLLAMLRHCLCFAIIRYAAADVVALRRD